MKAPDGEYQDAYILGINEPLESYKGIVIAIIHCGSNRSSIMGWNTSNGQWWGYCWYDLVSDDQKWSPKEYLQRTDAVLKKDNVFRTFIKLLREVKEKYDPAFVDGLKKKLWVLMA